MQTVESLYGMYVRCSDEEHQQYVELKAKLENCCHDIEKNMAFNDHRGTDIHFVSLDNGYKLSICMYNKELHLAIINKEKTQMYRKCEFNVLKNMTDTQINQINIRANNIINTPGRHIDIGEKITAMWKEAIVREKSPNAIHNKRENEMTLDERIQYYTIKKDVEKTFSEKSADTQDKSKARDINLRR